MLTPRLHHPARIAGALLLVLAAACAEQSRDPIGPDDPAGPGLAKGGPKAPPTSSGRIFFSSQMTGNFDLFSVNPDGTDLRRLTFGAELETQPAVSPDGKKVVYLRWVAGQINDIWIMNADGTQPRLRLAQPEFALHVYSPGWSPDGRSIVFSYQEAGTLKFRIASVGVRNGAPVVHLEGRMPSWSPDGQFLAYRKVIEGQGEQLVISRLDGSDFEQLASVADCCGHPQWSSDGHRILFYTGEGGTPTLRTFNLLNDTWTDLAPLPQPIQLAAWSPDAAKIAYVDGTLDLRVMLAGGGSSAPVLTGAKANGGISWSR